MRLSTLKNLFRASLLYSSYAFAPNSLITSSTYSKSITSQIERWKGARQFESRIIRPASFSIPKRDNVSSALHAQSMKGIELSGLLYDSCSRATEAWDWTANLGAPAALVGAAVLVTLSETREHMIPRKEDSTLICTMKKAQQFLLLSSFALEVTSIFVGMVTGSCLLGHGEQISKAAMVGYTSPLALLRHHHEFEYLTIQLSFLLGLFNWLGAVVLELLIPIDKETKNARKMNKCLASWLVTLMLWIIAFYNNHLNFYSSLFTMLCRYLALFPKRYFLCWPPRPMSLFYVPSFVMSGVLTWRAFRNSSSQGED